MRLFLVFIFFFLIEYLVRTFVDAFKYHSVGLVLEFLPLIISTVIGGLIYRKPIATGHFGRTYLKLTVVSISGLVLVKTFLFVQWYWFISPEYRNAPGDMIEGLGFTIAFLTFGTVVILLSYIPVVSIVKALTKKTSGQKTTTANSG